MGDVVVDSSVVTKWILPEVDSAKAHQLLSDVIRQGSRLIVLDLAFAEVANAIWKRFYRNLATADETRHFLRQLLACPVHRDSATRLLAPALEISMAHQRAIYDALFVALAQDLGLR